MDITDRRYTSELLEFGKILNIPVNFTYNTIKRSPFYKYIKVFGPQIINPPIYTGKRTFQTCRYNRWVLKKAQMPDDELNCGEININNFGIWQRSPRSFKDLLYDSLDAMYLSCYNSYITSVKYKDLLLHNGALQQRDIDGLLNIIKVNDQRCAITKYMYTDTYYLEFKPKLRILLNSIITGWRILNPHLYNNYKKVSVVIKVYEHKCDIMFMYHRDNKITDISNLLNHRGQLSMYREVPFEILIKYNNKYYKCY